MKLKYRLNDPENNIILPSKYFYELATDDSKISVNLSNPEDDYRKVNILLWKFKIVKKFERV